MSKDEYLIDLIDFQSIILWIESDSCHERVESKV